MVAPAWEKLKSIRKLSQAGTFGTLFTCSRCGGHMFNRPSLTYLKRFTSIPWCLITCSKQSCRMEFVLPEKDCGRCPQRVECLLYPKLEEIKYER